MKFLKYQGAGNDFIMIDQRSVQWIGRTDTQRIAQLCDRRFGIGADGLILLQQYPGFDFEMVYFNADGRESTMCGNGGRCIAAFAQHLGLANGACHFMAIDGEHEATITLNSADERWVELKMLDVQNVEIQENVYILNTGSPHYVRFEPSIENLDMVAEGRAIRYSDRWKKDGINVNLVAEAQLSYFEKQKHPSLHPLDIRTYERGVEDETFACGTGVTAAAIASFLHHKAPLGHAEIPVFAKGGELSVRFQAHENGHFTNIWLCGPAVRVFEGNITF